MISRFYDTLFFALVFVLQIHAQLNWEQTKGPYGGEVYDMKQDAKGNYYAASSGGLYFSTDNCESWSKINLGTTNNGLSEILIHPSGKLLVYGSDRFYRSDKEAKNWISGWLPVNNMFLNSKGVLYGRNQKSILTSVDTAKSWKEVYTFKDYGRNFYLIDDYNFVATADSSIYYSSDSGKSWQKSNLLFNWDSGFCLDSKKNIYAITNWDLYKSSDYGRSWQNIKDHKIPFPPIYVYRVFIDKADGIYLVSEHTFSYSSDGGVTWKDMGDIPYPVNKLWQDKNKKTYCLGGLDGISLYDPTAKTMTPKNIGINALYITQLFDWNNNLIACAEMGSDNLMNYKSTDYGNSWTKTDIPGRLITIDKLNRLFTLKYGSIMYTEDNGANWKQIVTPKYLDQWDAVIVLDQITMLILSDNKDLYKSDDLGKTWTKIFTFPTTYGYSGFLMTTGNELYLRIGSILYKSKNRGTTWTKEIEMKVSINSISESRWGTLFLSTANEMYAKAINGWEKADGFPYDYSADQILYTQKNIMFTSGWLNLLMSNDYGRTFTTLQDKIYEGYYYSAFTVSNDKYIFLAATGRGLFRASISEISTPTVYTEALLHNYPNPFNSQTNIEFFIKEPGVINVTIFNSLGERVEELVRNYASKGLYKIHWQPKNLSSGVYFYRLQTPAFSETKKMIYLR